MTEKLIEVFHQDDQPIAVHRRLRGTGLFSTLDAHYPEAKLSVPRFKVHHAKDQRLGPHVEQLVKELPDALSLPSPDINGHLDRSAIGV